MCIPQIGRSSVKVCLLLLGAWGFCGDSPAVRCEIGDQRKELLGARRAASEAYRYSRRELYPLGIPQEQGERSSALSH
jgi:hypothetical protein